MTSNWLNKLEKKIHNEIDLSKDEKSDYSQPVNNSSFAYPLLIFVLGLSIAFCGIWWWKGNNLFSWNTQTTVSQEQLWEEAWRAMSDRIESIDARIEEIATQQEKNREVINWFSPRLSLMAALHNNNVVEMRRHLKDAKLMALDRNWQIGGLPKNISFTEKGKEWIKQFIRTE